MSEQCSKRIYTGEFGRSRPCARKGVVEHDGRIYCRQHDPVAKAERDRKRDAKREAEYIASRQAYRMKLAAPDMHAALSRVVGILKDDLETHFGSETAGMIRAALAKANGHD